MSPYTFEGAHQQYSLDNQADAIARYAVAGGFGVEDPLRRCSQRAQVQES